MIQPTQHVLEAMAGLSGDPRFEAILEWLGQRREKSRDALEVQTEHEFARTQGRALELNEILTAAHGARDVLNAQRKTPSPYMPEGAFYDRDTLTRTRV